LSNFIPLTNDGNSTTSQTTIYINLDNISTFDVTYPNSEEEINLYRLTIRTTKETLNFKGEVAKRNIRLLEDAVTEHNWSRSNRPQYQSFDQPHNE
jgi:hypothetical protein